MKKRRSLLFYWNTLLLLLCLATLACYFLNFDPSTWKDESILALLPILLFPYFFTRTNLIKPVTQVRDSITETTEDNQVKKVEISKPAEFRDIADTFNTMQENISNASRFIKSIENGELDVSYRQNGDAENAEGKAQDPLEGALLSMRSRMQDIANDDRERNWVTEGLAKFIDLLRADNQDLKSLSDKIISNLVTYTGVNQGGLFIVGKDTHDGAEVHLELLACYAYDRKKFHEKKVRPGEGVLGQAFLEKETVHLKVLPDDYINITSGLGEAPPSSLLIVPLKMNEEVYGLIELASFHEFPTYKIELIERLGENIASTISNVQINAKTKDLLEASQQQAEELRSQEEEMRQNHEEMLATQEALQRKQSELEVSEKKSTAIFENSNDAIVVCDQRGKIDALNRTAKELFKVGGIDQQGTSMHVQQFIKKFDPDNPGFFKVRRRTRSTGSDGVNTNVEVYMSEEELAGVVHYILYARDISREMEKEHQIAQNLMLLDELKAEAKKSETSNSL